MIQFGIVVLCCLIGVYYLMKGVLSLLGKLVRRDTWLKIYDKCRLPFLHVKKAYKARKIRRHLHKHQADFLEHLESLGITGPVRIDIGGEMYDMGEIPKAQEPVVFPAAPADQGTITHVAMPDATFEPIAVANGPEAFDELRQRMQDKVKPLWNCQECGYQNRTVICTHCGAAKDPSKLLRTDREKLPPKEAFVHGDMCMCEDCIQARRDNARGIHRPWRTR